MPLRQRKKIQRLPREIIMITIDKLKCPQNHRCPAIKVCPVGAISQDGNDLPVINQEKCLECGACIRFCSMNAIQLKQ